MVNRVSAGGLQVRQYFHRYTDDALDLCDALASYVPTAMVKLDEISKILGLTGKPEGVDGSRVEEMVLAGQLEEVARYCESDVLNTYRVWLVYELFRGAITAKELDWSETQVKDFVASRKATNPHLCVAVGIRTHDAIPTETVHRTEPAVLPNPDGVPALLSRQPGRPLVVRRRLTSRHLRS
jgi:Predicted 3'-5' exonuclease related to the exonuclease domain of PolB